MIGKQWRAHEGRAGELYWVDRGMEPSIELVEYWRRPNTKETWVRIGKGGPGVMNDVFFLFRSRKKQCNARKDAEVWLDVLRAGGVKVAAEVKLIGWE
jgi:hypothetical protein